MGPREPAANPLPLSKDTESFHTRNKCWGTLRAGSKSNRKRESERAALPGLPLDATPRIDGRLSTKILFPAFTIGWLTCAQCRARSNHSETLRAFSFSLYIYIYIYIYIDLQDLHALTLLYDPSNETDEEEKKRLLLLNYNICKRTNF